jgi:tRNA (cytidine/uridine-2'-O-)-methyltransferase
VPEKIHKLVDNRIKIPLRSGKRSLNIASSVAIVLAESMRQNKII